MFRYERVGRWREDAVAEAECDLADFASSYLSTARRLRDEWLTPPLVVELRFTPPEAETLAADLRADAARAKLYCPEDPEDEQRSLALARKVECALHRARRFDAGEVSDMRWANVHRIGEVGRGPPEAEWRAGLDDRKLRPAMAELWPGHRV